MRGGKAVEGELLRNSAAPLRPVVKRPGARRAGRARKDWGAGVWVRKSDRGGGSGALLVGPRAGGKRCRVRTKGGRTQEMCPGGIPFAVRGIEMRSAMRVESYADGGGGSHAVCGTMS